MKRTAAILLIAIVWLMAFAMTAQAQEGPGVIGSAATDQPLDLETSENWEYLIAFASGPVVMALTEMIKRLGVKDGLAGKIAVALSVIAFAVLAYAKIYTGVDFTAEPAQIAVHILEALLKVAIGTGSAIGTFHVCRQGEILGE